MRSIDKIIVHCAATPPDMHVDAALINKWHKERGWRGIGYHYVICRDGVIQAGRRLAEVGAHVKGLNANSIGICLAGGKGGKATDQFSDHFTDEQGEALALLLDNLTNQFSGAFVHSHNEFANKACPCFNASAWWYDRSSRLAVLTSKADCYRQCMDLVDEIDDRTVELRSILQLLQEDE